MFRWLPVINHLFPGALTPFNVRSVSIEWWLIYARHAFEYETESKKQARQAKHGH